MWNLYPAFFLFCVLTVKTCNHRLLLRLPCVSICPHVKTWELMNNCLFFFFFFKFDVHGVLLECVYTFQFRLRLGRSVGYFTLKAMYISDFSSVVNHWIFFRIRTVLNTNCRKELNTIYTQERFSRSISD
jgi:hypothetical protein